MFGGVEWGAGYSGVHEAVTGVADFPGFGRQFLVGEVGGLAAGVVLRAGGLGGVSERGGKDGYGNDQGTDGGQGCSFRFWSVVMIQDMGGDVIREKGRAGKGANGVCLFAHLLI